jgi:gamma-glutamyltranspeptidase / glutathione hydrolase
VLRVLLSAIAFRMMVGAVSALWFSATSDVIDVSSGIPSGIPHGVEHEPERAGDEGVRSPKTDGFAAVHAIRVDPNGRDGGADPGHDGIVMAV